MRKLLPVVAASLAFAAATAQAAPNDPEAELSRALEGRVAGEPVSCIQLHRIRNSRIIPDTAIIYEVGDTLYVNRPRGGAQGLDRWDTLVTRTFGSQLCNTDTVELVDSPSRMMHGFVLLDEFVPYRRVRTSSAD